VLVANGELKKRKGRGASSSLPVSFISCAFKRIDNLGTYCIPPETGLIPSVYDNDAF
jgi:hypothetical protein